MQKSHKARGEKTRVERKLEEEVNVLSMIASKKERFRGSDLRPLSTIFIVDPKQKKCSKNKVHLIFMDLLHFVAISALKCIVRLLM